MAVAVFVKAVAQLSPLDKVGLGLGVVMGQCGRSNDPLNHKFWMSKKTHLEVVHDGKIFLCQGAIAAGLVRGRLGTGGG